jgi:zinc protease
MKAPAVLFCLVSLLAFLPAAAAAGEDAPWRLGREPRAFTLNNGLTVILQEDGAAPITVAQLLVRGGDRDDPPGMPGLSYLAARLSLEIGEPSKLQQLMDLGSSFSLSAGGDYSLVTIRSLSRHFDATLAVLAAMITEPLVSDLRVDSDKDLMRHLQKMEVDDPDSLMRKTLAGVFYDGAAYGAARFGDEASLARIGRKDIQSFLRSHYVAGNMTLVVISDLDEAEIRPLLASRLGGIAAGERPPSRPVPLRRPAQPAMAVERQTAQVLVSLTVQLPELNAGNFVLASLLESWLGKGIGSRLWRLRSRGSLAYGVNAEVQPNREAMLLSVSLKTDARRSAEAQAELEQLMRQAGSDGITAPELDAAKAYARADFWRENETREHRAATLAFLEGSGLSYRLGGSFTRRLEEIGLGEFNDFLRTWLAPPRWFILRIGPLGGGSSGPSTK